MSNRPSSGAEKREDMAAGADRDADGAVRRRDLTPRDGRAGKRYFCPGCGSPAPSHKPDCDA